MIKIKNLVYDKWLSEIIGKESYTLKLDEEFITRTYKDGTDENIWANSIQSNKTEPVFIQVKVSTQAVEQIKYLESISFFLIDTNVTLKKIIESQRFNNIKHESHDIIIRFAKDSDREGTVSVAGNTFLYSRFHLDPWFSNKLANRIKAQWVLSYFDGKRGDQMVIALSKNKIIGFLQIQKSEDNYFIIDLTGVDKEYQRKGIAGKMINFAIQKNNGINKVIVGTQIGNIPSFKLYQKMGFFLESAKYVFHFHKY